MGGTDHSAVAGITADEEDDPTRDLSESTEDDLIARVNEIVTVGEFYEMAPGGRVIFT